MNGLAYIGKITSLLPIPGADFIELAEAVCGAGGKWLGVVRKGEQAINNLCEVYVQDAIVPNTDRFAFMAQRHHRIKMVRFKGVPSEALIMPLTISGSVGDEVSELLGVVKYEKPFELTLAGEIAGSFPHFIPRTDEPNFQGVPWLVEALRGQPCYVTQKVDGSSGTFYRKDGQFGVCSRNKEYKDTPTSVLWNLARQYKLDTKQPDNTAIQFELIGPKVQGNPLKLAKPDIRVFNLWHIDLQAYGDAQHVRSCCDALRIPMVDILQWDTPFLHDEDGLRMLAEGEYPNGRQQEGIVLRPMVEQTIVGPKGPERLSFKVINLRYKEST